MGSVTRKNRRNRKSRNNRKNRRNNRKSRRGGGILNTLGNTLGLSPNGGPPVMALPNTSFTPNTPVNTSFTPNTSMNTSFTPTSPMPNTRRNRRNRRMNF